MGIVGSRPISVRTGGSSDRNATHAAVLVGAYFRAEQAATRRRRVARGAAIGILLIWAVNVLTSVLTPVDIVFGAGLIGVAAVATVIAEVRARMRLNSLIADTDGD